MYRIAGIALVLFLFAATAFAQIPGGNVFIGYSYLNADLGPSDRGNWNGWNGSVEGKVLPFIGIVADFSGHYGSLPASTVCPVAFLGACINTGAARTSMTFYLDRERHFA